MDNILNVIKQRSSTRKYTDEPLTKEELNTILEAGLQAPTGCNRQEIHFTVLSGDAPILSELNEDKNILKGVKTSETNFYFDAPTIIILSAQKDFKWSVLDAGIAVENMALAAESLGLGNLIIGSVFDVLRGEKREYYEKKFAFPKDYEFEIALAVGHKAVEKEPHTYDFDSQVTFM